MTVDSVWAAADTTPDAVERALREMLVERHREDPDATPARVLNLVSVVDKQWSGEIANRMAGVGRYQPSRSIVCQVEPGRETIDATVTVATEEGAGLHLAHELVVLDLGPQDLPHLETVVAPLVITDLPTMVWAPHGHHEAVDALLQISQIVLLDSIDEPMPAEALSRAGSLAAEAIVVDLAWLRSTPWRERIAALFDPPARRHRLQTISALTVRHELGSSVAAYLLIGWLASRLGWDTTPLMTMPDGTASGMIHAHRATVRVTLEPVDLHVRGLAGITIETADGEGIALDRGPGGLRAVRTDRRGAEQEWTIMGASRGEGGILGEGIRQAMLRDPVFRPALAGARSLLA